MESIEHFQIAERFRGPPRSGNGGYVCGRMAAHLGGTVAARLKAPPPLGTMLRLETAEEHARLFDGNTLIGEARVAAASPEPPPSPGYDQAVAASRGYRGFQVHAFPGCFVCGPDRATGDGLHIFPGPVAGTPLLATPWTPDPSLADDAGAVRPEFLWSALDCSGGFAVMPETEGLAVVLGELCATITGGLRAGERCVVIGWPLGSEGRKRLAGSAIYTAEGRLVARARATWLEVATSAWT